MGARYIVCQLGAVLLLLFSSLFLFAGVSTAFVPTVSRPNSVKAHVWGASQRHPFSAAAATTKTGMQLSAATTLEPPPTRETQLGKQKGGPAILERPPAVIERQQQQQQDPVPVKERKGMGSEAWEVRIYNDGLNTREHVARSLVQVTGLSELQAYQTMMQAHQNGIAAVGRWVYEVAEMYHDALKKKGIVCDIIPVDEE